MTKDTKIVLIGAGSLQFGLGAVGNIINSSILKGCKITLHDINEKNLNLVSRACHAKIEEENLDFQLEATLNREEALENADFIINSIEVTPRFELWDQDYEIPRKHGNKQVMGENGGPGGLFHSLRVIPPILDICHDVEKICPNAFFINFSNPMSRICLAIKRDTPKVKFVGLCHEIDFARQHLPKMLETPLEKLEIYAGGLNHFGVILETKYKESENSALAEIQQKAPQYLNQIPSIDGRTLQQFILKNYGYLPYTGDSHYGEYIHWAWEIADMDGIKQFKEGYQATVRSAGKKLARWIRKGRGAKLVEPDDESAVPIIEAIITDANMTELSVNIPNDGIYTNLPEDLVIECPAKINKEGVHGIPYGKYPSNLVGLLQNQASVQDLCVEAARKQSKDLALKALLVDPGINSVSQAEQILEEMILTQKGKLYLN